MNDAFFLLILNIIILQLKTQTLYCRACIGFTSSDELENAELLLRELNITAYDLEKKLEQLKLKLASRVN